MVHFALNPKSGNDRFIPFGAQDGAFAVLAASPMGCNSCRRFESMRTSEFTFANAAAEHAVRDALGCLIIDDVNL